MTSRPAASSFQLGGTEAAERLAETEDYAKSILAGKGNGAYMIAAVGEEMARRALALAACLRDAEQRAEQAEAERANAAEAATEAATVALWLDVRGTKAKLTRAEAALERVRAALLMGGQSADIRARAALRALSAPADDGGEG